MSFGFSAAIVFPFRNEAHALALDGFLAVDAFHRAVLQLPVAAIHQNTILHTQRQIPFEFHCDQFEQITDDSAGTLADFAPDATRTCWPREIRAGTKRGRAAAKRCGSSD